MTRVRKKYAWYRGWFRDYNGVLKEAYKNKKMNRMETKVSQFFEKYGADDYVKSHDVLKELDITEQTLVKYRSFLELGVHYKINAANRYKYSREGIDRLRELMSAKKLAFIEKARETGRMGGRQKALNKKLKQSGELL